VQRDQADLVTFVERHGHGLRALLAKPEMFDRMGFALECNVLLRSRRSSFPGRFIEVDPEQATLIQILKSCGTTRVETLRQHAGTSLNGWRKRIAGFCAQ
jgi:hypothetical protein